jgi:hypothetical protein
MTVEEAKALPVGALIERPLPLSCITPHPLVPTDRQKYFFVVVGKETQEGETVIRFRDHHGDQLPPRTPPPLRRWTTGIRATYKDNWPEWWAQTRRIA